MSSGQADLFAQDSAERKQLSEAQLSALVARLEEALDAGLVSADHLIHDILASLNAAELAKRQFREIARVAGLIFQGYPGSSKSVKQVQASSGLLYDVFARYDPENLLLFQAHREVLEKQLEQSRLGLTLDRISGGRIILRDVERPTPLAFALLVDRAREQVSSEKFLDRVRRLVAPLERAAAAGSVSARFGKGRGRGFR